MLLISNISIAYQVFKYVLELINIKFYHKKAKNVEIMIKRKQIRKNNKISCFSPVTQISFLATTHVHTHTQSHD